MEGAMEGGRKGKEKKKWGFRKEETSGGGRMKRGVCRY